MYLSFFLSLNFVEYLMVRDQHSRVRINCTTVSHVQPFHASIFLPSLPTVPHVFVLATTAAMCSAPQMLALARALWQVRSQWLDQVILPHLMEQSLGVESIVLSPSTSNNDKRNLSREKPIVVTDASDCPYLAGTNVEGLRGSIEGLSAPIQVGWIQDSERPILKGGNDRRCQSPSTVRAGSREPNTNNQQDRDQCAPASTAGQKHSREREDVDFELYTERMRTILRTAISGLFSSDACGVLAELMVSNNMPNSIRYIFGPLRPMRVQISEAIDMDHHGHLRNQPKVLWLTAAR